MFVEGFLEKKVFVKDLNCKNHCKIKICLKTGKERGQVSTFDITSFWD